MAAWLTKLRGWLVVGSLFCSSFVQAQVVPPGSDAMPQVSPTAAPPMLQPSLPAARPLANDIMLNPDFIQPPLPVYLTPTGQPKPLPVTQPAPQEPISVTPNAVTQSCDSCAGTSSRWTFANWLNRKQCNSCDGNGGPFGHGKYRLLGGRCYDHIDDYNTCTTLQTECRFIFGSCRAFFGETCYKEPPPVPVPPGYALPPTKRGW